MSFEVTNVMHAQEKQTAFEDETHIVLPLDVLLACQILISYNFLL